MSARFFSLLWLLAFHGALFAQEEDPFGVGEASLSKDLHNIYLLCQLPEPDIKKLDELFGEVTTGIQKGDEASFEILTVLVSSAPEQWLEKVLIHHASKEKAEKIDEALFEELKTFRHSFRLASSQDVVEAFQKSKLTMYRTLASFGLQYGYIKWNDCLPTDEIFVLNNILSFYPEDLDERFQVLKTVKPVIEDQENKALFNSVLKRFVSDGGDVKDLKPFPGDLPEVSVDDRYLFFSERRHENLLKSSSRAFLDSLHQIADRIDQEVEINDPLQLCFIASGAGAMSEEFIMLFDSIKSQELYGLLAFVARKDFTVYQQYIVERADKKHGSSAVVLHSHLFNDLIEHQAFFQNQDYSKLRSLTKHEFPSFRGIPIIVLPYLDRAGYKNLSVHYQNETNSYIILRCLERLDFDKVTKNKLIERLHKNEAWKDLEISKEEFENWYSID